MADTAKLAQEARAHIPDALDVCASFVLFRTSDEEIERSVRQVLDARANTHVVLVDNTVPPIDLKRWRDRRITIVSAGANLGYGRANNIALKASTAKSRYHLVLNTDLHYNSDVIDGIVAFMDDHPDVGLAMPRIEYPDGTLQRLCRLLPVPLNVIGRRFFSWTEWARSRNREYEFHDWNYDTVAEFPFLSGCFMFLRHTILEKAGFFDERFFMFAEDIDLSRRVNEVSRTLYVPHFTVTHEYRSQTRPSFRRFRYAMASFIKYFTKWGWIMDRKRDTANLRALSQFTTNADTANLR